MLTQSYTYARIKKFTETACMDHMIGSGEGRIENLVWRNE
jgi:hypothetical protein